MNYFAALQGSDPEAQRAELAAREEQRRAASAASNGSTAAAARRQQREREWEGPGLKQPLVWVDCEMTGLDVESDQLLQIAVICTGGLVQAAWPRDAARPGNGTGRPPDGREGCRPGHGTLTRRSRAVLHFASCASELALRVRASRQRPAFLPPPPPTPHHSTPLGTATCRRVAGAC